MATDAWVINVTATGQSAAGIGTNNGDGIQLYPAWVTAGVAKATSSNGQLLRRPLQGALHSIQIEPDGSNGGSLQIYDMDATSEGADVSSAATVTAAQIAAALAATPPRAKLLFEQTFAGTVGSGIVNAPGINRAFMKGLVARFGNGAGAAAAGSCTLNLVVDGGYEKVESRGGY